jgi:hypothetical protein
MGLGQLSKRDVNLLLIVLGLGVTLAVYFLVFLDFTARAETLNAQTESLRPRLAVLRGYEAEVPSYNRAIREYADFIARELGNYAQEVRTEDLIMYAVMLENEMKLNIASASFTEPAAVSEFTLPDEDGAPLPYRAYAISMTLSSRMGYAELKNAIDRLYATADRTVLDAVSVTFDAATGGLVGTVTISKIFIADGSYVYTETAVPPGPLGNSNPFGTIRNGT